MYQDQEKTRVRDGIIFQGISTVWDFNNENRNPHFKSLLYSLHQDWIGDNYEPLTLQKHMAGDLIDCYTIHPAEYRLSL